MNSNYSIIQSIIEYVEENLDKPLSVTSVSDYVGYSKYHIHRMFTAVTGLTLHNYIVRRRLTESAKELVFSDRSIMDISYDAGYDSQQAYTQSFKKHFKMSPLRFRKLGTYAPIQLKFRLDNPSVSVKGDRIMDITIKEMDALKLVGYKCNTMLGFIGIAKAWKDLTKNIEKITGRCEEDMLIGLNDYKTFDLIDGKQPKFDYYAVVEVKGSRSLPKKMIEMNVEASRYAVFKFRGKNEDPLDKVYDYIYKTWFPESTYELNENAKLDFAKYSTLKDAEGLSDIEVHIPIK